MYIPEEMKKVNRFVDVAIPENKMFFQRLGEVKVDPANFTGDEPAPMNQSKIDQIEAYSRYAEEMAKPENERSNEPD